MRDNDIRHLEMPDFDKQEGEQLTDAENRPSLDMLVNVPMRVTVELGRARLPVKEILRLTPGALVDLDRASGEPLTIYINGEPFAYGEAVLVNQERFGVRLTAIINADDKLKSPREM